VLPQLSKIKEAALDILFPKKCLGCGAEGVLICHTCQKTIVRIMPPVCPKCGRPQPSGILCHRCVSWPSAIDGVRSPLQFEGIIREAIHQFKYNNLRVLSGTLAAFLHEFLLNNSITGDVFVPVPLHPKRLKERGYNQAGLLARELGKKISLPVNENCLVRIKHVSPQALTGSVLERRNNVYQAFICRNLSMENKHVILVDDVATSGATLDACAIALKLSGALSVWGLVLAREI
jgi:ComF family protein